eukprot:1149104-Pelagomonas_calceolata.AAC.2
MASISLSKSLIVYYLRASLTPAFLIKQFQLPDVTLVTPCPGNEAVRSSTTPARQLYEMSIQNHHIHLIEIKYRYCGDTRPGAQLEASQQNTVKFAYNFKVTRSLSIQSSWGLTRKGLPNLYESSMPTLCNVRTNLPLPDMPLKTKPLNITLVPWGRMLSRTHQTHTSFPPTLWPTGVNKLFTYLMKRSETV